MVSNATLKRIRDRVRKFYPASCTIEAEDTGTDQYGASTHTWVTVAENVPCRIIRAGQNTSGEAGMQGRQEVMEDRYRLSVPVDTALAIDQRVTVNGVTYDVVNIISAWSDAVDAQAIITRSRGEG